MFCILFPLYIYLHNFNYLFWLSADDLSNHTIFSIPISNHDSQIEGTVVGRSTQADLVQAARDRSQKMEKQEEGQKGCSIR